MKKKILSLVLALAMFITGIPFAGAIGTGFNAEKPSNTAAQSKNPGLESDANSSNPSGFAGTDSDSKENGKIVNDAANRFSEKMEAQLYSADDEVTFIVKLDRKALLSEFSADEIAEKTDAVIKYESEQHKAIEILKSRLNKKLASDKSFDIGFNYTIAMTGVSVTTEYGNKAAIEAIPGVEKVYIAPMFELPDDSAFSAPGDVQIKPMTGNATSMIGSDILNELGYTGKGMKIAILDTGIVVNHKSFAALSEDQLTSSSLTQESVDAIWDTLNASAVGSRNYSYHNSKIPYIFNYTLMSFDVSHSTAGSDHGTHVAGIAAANRIEGNSVVGVAPEAQLVVMQVFGKNGASWDTIMAALEDCVRLDVDAVNLSLGSACGFTQGNADMQAILDAFSETDIEVLIAAGNDSNSAYGNRTGLNMSLSSNPDVGLAGTPSTYPAALSIASVDNDGEELLYFTVGNEKIGFTDTAASSFTRFFGRFMGQTLDFVIVPGNGLAGDYANLDVTGKVAVVSRGGSTFMEKQAAAQAAGAIACIVYNNVPGAINMQINDGGENIPCISISLAGGSAMKRMYENGTTQLTVCQGDLIHVTMGRTVSSFSSWGVTPDLKLKPELAGVGGNILSSTDTSISGAEYGIMSGTSMATPQVAGAMAVILQYIKTIYPSIGEGELRRVAANLMMSTANPVMYGEIEYSPRAQGAGLVDLIKATNSGAYLSNPNAEEGRPKAEFGDDDEKTGRYEFPVEIHNINAEQDRTYTFDASVFTETLYMGGYIAGYPTALEAGTQVYANTDIMCYDFNDDGGISIVDALLLMRHVLGVGDIAEDNAHYPYLDVNEDGAASMVDVVLVLAYCANLGVDIDMEAHAQALAPVDEITVPAGESVSLTVRIELTANDKQYLNESFENGMYIEGFFYANSADENGINLSMPFIGFYGDWSDAPIFDDADASKATVYPRYAFTNMSLIGSNPYINGGKSGDEYNAFSDANPLAELDIGLLRGARRIKFTVVNAETGEEYWSLEGENIAKSFFNSNYGMVIPFYVVSDKGEVWNGKDADGNDLPGGTRVTYTTTAWVDDGDDIPDDVWAFDITLDNQYPVINNASELQDSLIIAEDNSKVELELTITEDNYIAAVMFVNPDGTIMGKFEADNTPGEPYTAIYDITGFGSDFTIVAADYACNETELDAILDLGDASISPQLQTLDMNRIYGCETSTVDAISKGWFSADKTDLSELRNENFDTANLYYSGEFVNGYVVAQRTDGALVMLYPYNTYWGSQTLLTQSGSVGKEGFYVLYDMALNYATDELWAVGWKYTEADANGNNGYNALFKIEFWANGYIEVSERSRITGTEGGEVLLLGCTTEGQYYAIDTDARLYTVDTDTGVVSYVATTSFTEVPGYAGVNVIQSMGYDHNSGTMYWAAHSQQSNRGNTISYTYTLDLETGECTEIGGYGESGSTALFIPTDRTTTLFTMGTNPTGFNVSPYSLTMATGQRKLLSVSWTPWTAAPQNVTWASDNPDVVSVNNAGLVTAIGEGTATITATTRIWDQWAATPDWREVTSNCTITVVPSQEAIYGYIISDFKNSSNDFSWVTFSDQNPAFVSVLDRPMVEVLGQDGPVDQRAIWQGGAYYNGKVYTVQVESWEQDGYIMSGTALYCSTVTKGDTPEETTFGKPMLVGRTAGIEVGNIAFDYNTGRMYGTDFTNGGLCIIDLDSASIDPLGEFSGDLSATWMTAMCVTADGIIIGADMGGNLYSVDSDTLYCKRLGTAPSESQFYASMTYDYNTGNIYWNPCQGAGNSPLYLVCLGEDEWSGDLAVTIVDIGDVSTKAGVEMTAMFTIPDVEPETHFIPITGISIDSDDVTGVVGGTIKLNAITEPLRPTVQARRWTSADETVVTVDNLGVMRFVGVGETTVTVSITDKGDDPQTYTDSINVRVVASGGQLTAFLTEDYAGSSYYDYWLDMSDYAVNNTQLSDRAINVYTIRTGEYYDGYIYAYNDEGEFYRIDNTDRMNYVTLGTCNLDLENDQVVSMAMDYTTGRMYAITLSGKLATVNLADGSLNIIASLSSKIFALAADIDGTLYAAGSNGYRDDATLCTVDKETGTCTALMTLEGAQVFTGPNYYGTTQYNPQMTYDITTNRLYLNATSKLQGSYTNSGLFMIQLGDDPEVFNLGKPALLRYSWDGSVLVKKGEMMLGLLCAIPETDELPEGIVNGIIMSKDYARVALGSQLTLEASVLPSNAPNTDVIWTSSDESIATVENGIVTGLAAGTVTITASSAADDSFSSSCEVTVVERTGEASTAYTISSKLNKLIAFDPELPGEITEIADFNTAAGICGLDISGRTMYYALNEGGAYPMLYRYDMDSKTSIAIGQLGVWTDAVNDLVYNEENGYIYVVTGFYVYRFDPAYMSVDSLNFYEASLDITVVDTSYPTVAAITCIGEDVYFMTSGWRGVQLCRADKNLQNYESIGLLDINIAAGLVEMAYDPSRELFYATDTNSRLHSFDINGENAKTIDFVGNYLDVRGLAIVPFQANGTDAEDSSRNSD